MGWRIAAAWALIGLASHCFASAIQGFDLRSGLEQALVHYATWGIAGFVVGSITQGIILDAFRNRVIASDRLEIASRDTSTIDPSG